MRRIARRLDRDPAPLEARRQRAFGNKFVEHSVEERGILGVKRHGAPLAQQSRVTSSGVIGGRAPCDSLIAPPRQALPAQSLYRDPRIDHLHHDRIVLARRRAYRPHRRSADFAHPAAPAGSSGDSRERGSGPRSARCVPQLHPTSSAGRSRSRTCPVRPAHYYDVAGTTMPEGASSSRAPMPADRMPAAVSCDEDQDPEARRSRRAHVPCGIQSATSRADGRRFAVASASDRIRADAGDRDRSLANGRLWSATIENQAAPTCGS